MASISFTDFERFVSQYAEDFRSAHRESEARIASAESQLDLTFPDSLRWLLTEFGYSKHCGVASLDYILRVTLSKRPKLPRQTVILGQPALDRIPFEAGRPVCAELSRTLGLVLMQAATRPETSEQIVLVQQSNSQALVKTQSGPPVTSLENHASYPSYVMNRWCERHPEKAAEVDQLLMPEVIEQDEVETPDVPEGSAEAQLSPAEFSKAEMADERNPMAAAQNEPDVSQLVTRLAETMLSYQTTKAETADTQLPELPQQDTSFPDLITGQSSHEVVTWPTICSGPGTSGTPVETIQHHLQQIEACHKVLISSRHFPKDWNRSRSSSPRQVLSLPSHLCGGTLWLTSAEQWLTSPATAIPEVRYWVMKWQEQSVSDRYGHLVSDRWSLLSWLPPEYPQSQLAGRAVTLAELNGWSDLFERVA